MTEFLQNKANKKLIVAGALILMILLLCSPLFALGCVNGDDSEFHISRIKNIADGIQNENLPVKIHPTSVNNYGYGTGLFYPNLFLYLPATLVAFGLDLSVSYELFVAAINTAVVLSTYFSSKQITKSRFSALTITLLFTTAQTVLNNLYSRSALGESLAMIFIPMVIAGVHNLVHENFSKPLIISGAFLGIVYSHTISLLLSAVVAGGYLLLNIRKIFSFRKQGFALIGKLCLCAAGVLLLSVSYWLPMLEQLFSEKFELSEPWTYLSENSLSFIRLLSPVRPGLGLFLILLSAGLIVYLYTKHKGEIRSSFREPLGYLFAGLLIALLASKLFPWKLLDKTFLNNIQFPWRLFPYAAFFLSLGSGICISRLVSDNPTRIKLVSVITALTLIAPIVTLTTQGLCSEPLSSDPCNHPYALGYAEWLPLDTDKEALTRPHTVVTDNDDTFLLSDKKGSTVSFCITEKTKDSEYFDVPLLYYKGYVATVTDTKGNTETLPISDSDNNLIRLKSPQKSGMVTVAYTGTPIQRTAYLINIVSAVICTAGLVAGYAIKRTKKNTST